MKKIELDWKEYIETSNQAVEEGCVLVRNEKETLPLASKSKVALFGRMQKNYYKSGTGSGGMVNVNHVINISEGIHHHTDFEVDSILENTYEEWEEKNPFDFGEGWGSEPWAQEEMEVSESFVADAAKRNDCAIVFIGRTAGEDQDNKLVEGSFLLTKKEKDLMKKVTIYFEKTIVLLNVGNIMDMSFVESYQPSAVLYVWQGGMIGGSRVADILSGKVNPSGKLPDTIAYSNSDYIAGDNFGEEIRNFYQEDIFVGYRYFETFAKDNVRYPFGYGLSYTQFQIDFLSSKEEAEEFVIQVKVKNIGHRKGKEVVQIYAEAPAGNLGKAARNLVAFQKTSLLAVEEEQVLTMKIPYAYFASFDDSGVTGYANSFVLEPGEYQIYVGNDVRKAEKMTSFVIAEIVIIETTTNALHPEKPFKRMVSKKVNQAYQIEWEEVPICEKTQGMMQKEEVLQELNISEDRRRQCIDATMLDVLDEKLTMEEFVALFTDVELMTIACGEGMGSPKVTAGTAAAFGGVCTSLKEKKVPCGCCSDGPSGLRLETGARAMSLPNGTLLASTFNTELIEELYAFVAKEMIKNEVDILLGPGMNIHRYPLNGRNFEYFSEDPILTGKMAKAQIKALQKNGVTGSLKHFCCNNQETYRHQSDSVVSARALREIYLKGFEIAVKEAKATAIMTTYGSLNGAWTAGNYDLNTRVLREDWKFKGFTMTDWWANVNEEGKGPDKFNFATMVKAQNDVYMVVPDADNIENLGNLPEKLAKNEITRAQLQRCALNICEFLKDTQAMQRMKGEKTDFIELHEEETEGNEEDGINLGVFQLKDTLSIPFADKDTSKGKTYIFNIELAQIGDYEIALTGASNQSELAQMAVTLFQANVPVGVYSYHGTGGKDCTLVKEKHVVAMNAQYKIFIRQGGLQLKELKISYLKKEK